MEIDLNKLNHDNLKESKNYLFSSLGNNVIQDVRDPDTQEYMKYANILSAYIIKQEGDRANVRFWKDLYKSFCKSEKQFNYKLYKGHILIKIAMASLITERDLDKITYILNQASQEDVNFGYKNPTYRPAYKILSFLQPLLMFRNRLWPSNNKTREKVGTRLWMILHFNKSSYAIAMQPSSFIEEIQKCIKNNNNLLSIIKENAEELLDIALLGNQNAKFYKSVMFLSGNIIEGILYDLALRYQAISKQKKCTFAEYLKNIFHKKRNKTNLNKASIEKLSHFLREKGVVDEPTEYLCRFIQHYRDFVHPARNMKHEFRLDENFSKMFIFFLILLFNDLQKASQKII